MRSAPLALVLVCALAVACGDRPSSAGSSPPGPNPAPVPAAAAPAAPAPAAHAQAQRPAPAPVPAPSRGGTAVRGSFEAKPLGAPAAVVVRREPDAEGLKQLFTKRRADVQRCYETALARNPGAAGKLTLEFTIAESGGLEDVRVARSTFHRRDVDDCIAGVVRGWKTPFRPAEPVAVEYPLAFAPSR